MKICQEHEKPFSEKSPNKAGKYWHVVDFDKNEFHSVTKEEYDALPGEMETETREPLEGSKANGMLICNAMNNAVSMVNQGTIQIENLELYFEKILSAMEKRS